MDTHSTNSSRKRTAYQIVVGAELSERFAVAFEEMEVRNAGGQAILTGEVVDQSHLHGILNRINALGLELVSLQPVSENPKKGAERLADESTDPGEPRDVTGVTLADGGVNPCIQGPLFHPYNLG